MAKIGGEGEEILNIEFRQPVTGSQITSGLLMTATWPVLDIPVAGSVAVIELSPRETPLTVTWFNELVPSATFELERDHFTEFVRSCCEPSLYTPIAKIGLDCLTWTKGEGGMMRIDISASAWHVPKLQKNPGAQLFRQVPQLLSSAYWLTQTPLQHIAPAAALQTLPQVPQFALSSSLLHPPLGQHKPSPGRQPYWPVQLASA
jgi:hypothetical protein